MCTLTATPMSDLSCVFSTVPFMACCVVKMPANTLLILTGDLKKKTRTKKRSLIQDTFCVAPVQIIMCRFHIAEEKAPNNKIVNYDDTFKHFLQRLVLKLTRSCEKRENTKGMRV